SVSERATYECQAGKEAAPSLAFDPINFFGNLPLTIVASPVHQRRPRVVAGMKARMSEGYLEVISLIERLHRQVLEVIKLELDRLGMHDINNVQAMMLFNIGDA